MPSKKRSLQATVQGVTFGVTGMIFGVGGPPVATLPGPVPSTPRWRDRCRNRWRWSKVKVLLQQYMKAKVCAWVGVL